MKSVASLAGMILCMTISQILLKMAGQHSAAHAGAVEGFMRNPWPAALGASPAASAAGCSPCAGCRSRRPIPGRR